MRGISPQPTEKGRLAGYGAQRPEQAEGLLKGETRGKAPSGVGWWVIKVDRRETVKGVKGNAPLGRRRRPRQLRSGGCLKVGQAKETLISQGKRNQRANLFTVAVDDEEV